MNFGWRRASGRLRRDTPVAIHAPESRVAELGSLAASRHRFRSTVLLETLNGVGNGCLQKFVVGFSH